MKKILPTLAALVLGCTPKQQITKVIIASTVPYARHVAADVILNGQEYEGAYWKIYTFGGEQYTFLYKPLGDRGNFDDDILIMQYGETPQVQFLDQSVVGGISYVVSIDGSKAAHYSEFPFDFRKQMQTMYLDSLLRINSTFKPEEIKALEAIVPP